MKTQKIFLLMFVLLLALSLASCGLGKSADMPDCFVIEEQESYADAAELPGKIVAYNEEYDLVALETVKVETGGSTARTVKVYDLANGNRVLFMDTTTIMSEDEKPLSEYHLDNYPIIKVVDYYSDGQDDSGNTIYEQRYDYYLIDAEYEARNLMMSVTEDTLEVERVNNLFIAKYGEVVSWINRDFEVIREVLADASDSYVFGDAERYFAFDAEYKDYLYTWEFDPDTLSQTIIVYGTNGVACAQYNFSAGTSYINGIGGSLIDPKAYVLNNGNVLIQECILVEDDGEYDFVYGPTKQKFKLVTKIMDIISSYVGEVPCDYLIANLESAYSRVPGESDFAFALAEGYENQALIVSVADGVLGRKTEYVVLSNSLEVVYTLENDYLANSAYDSKRGYAGIGYITADGYMAFLTIDGVTAAYRFEWDGSIAAVYPTNADEAVADYYLTANGIYRLKKNELVFDLAAFGATDIYVMGEDIYVCKPNEEKNTEKDSEDVCIHPIECYRIDLAEGTAILVADGVDESFIPVTRDGAYSIVNEKSNVASYYNKDGTLVLAYNTNNLVTSATTENTIMINVCDDGVYKTYILYVADLDMEGK